MSPGGWIDISVPIRSGMVHWPGDPEIRVERFLSMDEGEVCNASRLEMGSHTGTHMDAPLHFIRDGLSIDRVPPDITCGPARILPITDDRAVTAAELRPFGIRPGERILLRTRNSECLSYGGPFAEDFVHISADAARYLVELRVALVGVDYLSVGAFAEDGDGVETHQVLLGAGIWLVEGLDLSQVKPGPVELLCLPLRLQGCDGAPARAFIRPLESAPGSGPGII